MKLNKVTCNVNMHKNICSTYISDEGAGDYATIIAVN